MAQSCHFKKWGRDISFTSRAAASEGNKNSLWVMKGTMIFTHERLSRNTEDKFPHERRSREWGNLFSVWLLSLEWVNIIVPWMTNREFFPSPFFKMTGLTFLFNYWKLFKHWKFRLWLALFWINGLLPNLHGIMMGFFWNTVKWIIQESFCQCTVLVSQ